MKHFHILHKKFRLLLLIQCLLLLLLLLCRFSRVRLCDPTDSSPPGSPVPGILQARTLEWVAISFSNAWKRKVKVKLLSCVRLFATPWTAAYQAPQSMGFSRQEYWSGVPLPSPHSVFTEYLLHSKHSSRHWGHKGSLERKTLAPTAWKINKFKYINIIRTVEGELKGGVTESEECIYYLRLLNKLLQNIAA